MNQDDSKEITEEQLQRVAVLMKSKGRNSYEYLSRPRVRVCPVCGEVFETLGRGRPKRFCSEECRSKYHHQHPNPANWKSTRIAVCPVCGKEFQASKEYGRLRKYCSRACANRGRAKEQRNLMSTQVDSEVSENSQELKEEFEEGGCYQYDEDSGKTAE